MPTRHRLICALLAVACAGPALADGCATVQLSNVRPQQGHLMIAAYANAQSFGKTPQAELRVPAGAASMTLQLCGLAGTEVAITLFQDMDSDGKLARNVLGLPTEPWGSSGTPGVMGPNWDNSKVALDGKPIAVQLSQ